MDNNNSTQIKTVDINEILPNRFQPRIEFDESEILGLSDSIKEHGIINPILARKIGNKYEIIAGERRYKAAVLAGLDEVPIIVKDLNDQDSAEIALLENVQRKNMSPIEESISFQKILDMGSITQEHLAEKIGKSQSYIANKIRLLKLSDEVQEALLKNKISERHARSLLKIKEQEKQNIMLDKIIKERLTVRKTDEEIDKMNESNSFFNTIPTVETQPEVNQTQEPAQIIPASLDSIFGSKVTEEPKLEDQAKANEELLKSAQSGSNSFFSFGVQEPTNSNEIKGESNSQVSDSNKNIVGTPEAVSLANEVLNNAPMFGTTVQPNSTDVSNVSTTGNNSILSMSNEQPSIIATSPIIETVEPATPVTEPVVPVAPAIETQPEITPTIPTTPIVEPVVPVAPAMETQSEIAPAIPATPVTEPVAPVASTMETQSEITPPIPTLVPTSPIVESSEQIKEEPAIMPEPIIITDYSKEYDPVMPNVNPEPVQKVDFKSIIKLIRDCSKSIEDSGYIIETEEYDLEGMYQVVFKINKD